MALTAQNLIDAAKRAVSSGNLQAAETNLRLALSFSPNDRVITAELERVLAERERVRPRPA